MTARITFHTDGSDITIARLGVVEVGRLCDRSGKQSWMFHLGPKGSATCIVWHDARSLLAAKNALLAEIEGWMRMAGVAQI